MFVSAIIVAAGKGERFRSKTPKPLVKIGAKPIIVHSLKALSGHPWIKEIIVVANPLNIRGIVTQAAKYRIKKIKAVLLGGMRRQDSVRSGLRAVSRRAGFVLVHDGGRPFINEAVISAVVKKAVRTGAAIAAVPVKATIKKANSRGMVEKTIDREKLWEVQTPQVFRRQLLINAHEKFGQLDVTDDAMLVEKAGAKVAVVMASYYNIKVTTPEDLVLAKAILKAKV